MGGRGRNMSWTDLKLLFAYGMAIETAGTDLPPEGSFVFIRI